MAIHAAIMLTAGCASTQGRTTAIAAACATRDRAAQRGPSSTDDPFEASGNRACEINLNPSIEASILAENELIEVATNELNVIVKSLERKQTLYAASGQLELQVFLDKKVEYLFANAISSDRITRWLGDGMRKLGSAFSSVVRNLLLMRKLSEENRIEIAKIAAAQPHSGVSQYIQNYGITNESALIEIAKIAATSRSSEVSKYIRNYGIRDESTLIEIAKIAAATNGLNTSIHIENYGIRNESVLIEIAKIAVAQVFWAASIYIKNYKIRDKIALIEIAKIAAAWHGESVSQHIQDYEIDDELPLIEIAKIAATQDGLKTSENIKNYGITSSQALWEIMLIALRGTREYYNVLSNFQHFYKLIPEDLMGVLDVVPLLFFSLPQGLDYFHLKEPVAFDNLAKYVRYKLRDEPLLASLLANQNILTETVRRESVVLKAMGALALIYAQHHNPHDPAPREPLPVFHSLAEILAYGLGLPHSVVISWSSLSKDRLGDLLEIGLDLYRILALNKRNLFSGIHLPEVWFESSNTKLWVNLISTTRDLLALKGNQANQSAWIENQWLSIWQTEGTDPARLLTTIQNELLHEVQNLFQKNKALQSLTMEDIEKLRVAWGGDLSPIFTLLARFNERPAWRDEIPVLARIFSAVLAHKFEELKFEGDSEEDRVAAKEQLSHLDAAAKEEWKRQPSILGITNPSAAPEDPSLAIRDHLRTNIVPHLKSLLEPLLESKSASEQEQNKIIAAYLKQGHSHYEFTVLLQAVQAYCNKRAPSQSQGLRPLAQNDIESLRKLSKLLTQTLHSPEKGKAQVPLDQAMLSQLIDDFKTLNDLTKPTVIQNPEKKEIVFTAIFHDPKLLLTVGALVNAASCQDYTCGSHIQTLPGYVLDAGVKAMASWVLSRKNFASQKDYDDLLAALEGGQVLPHTFNASQKIMMITLPQGRTVTTLPLGYAHRRYIIKTGRTASGAPALRRERGYLQPHQAADPTITAQSDQLYFDMAHRMRASPSGEPMHVAPSRNDGGVYSDAVGGAMRGTYVMP